MPPDFEKDLRNLYLALSELLKHFWHCFPPTTQELENKALKMHEALQRFKMAKLQPFEVSFFTFYEKNKLKFLFISGSLFTKTFSSGWYFNTTFKSFITSS